MMRKTKRRLKSYRLTAEVGKRPKRTRSRRIRIGKTKWKITRVKAKIKAKSLRGATAKFFTRLRKRFGKSKRVSIHINTPSRYIRMFMSGKRV